MLMLERTIQRPQVMIVHGNCASSGVCGRRRQSLSSKCVKVDSVTLFQSFESARRRREGASARSRAYRSAIALAKAAGQARAARHRGTERWTRCEVIRIRRGERDALGTAILMASSARARATDARLRAMILYKLQSFVRVARGGGFGGGHLCLERALEFGARLERLARFDDVWWRLR